MFGHVYHYILEVNDVYSIYASKPQEHSYKENAELLSH